MDPSVEIWVPAVSALLGAVVGAGALLLAQSLQWSRERKERIKVRSEESAALILTIVDSLQSQFRSYWGNADGPPQIELFERYLELSRFAVDIVPDTARKKLREVADAFYYYPMIMPYGPEDGYTVSQIGYKLGRDSHKVIGALRRGESVVPETPRLDDLTQRIKDFGEELDAIENPPDPEG